MKWKQRWSQEPAYSMKELGKLCCGWNPGSGKIPNPTRLALTIEDIRRAATIGIELTPLPRTRPATAGEIHFDEHWYFAREQATAWAAKRYSKFPYRVASTTDASVPPDRKRLIAHRWRLIDNCRHEKKIASRSLFSKLPEFNGEMKECSLGAIVRDERRKYKASARETLLIVLGTDEQTWNNPI